MNQLTGKWKGSYNYYDEDDQFCDETYFEMDILIDNGVITGEINDADEKVTIPMVAKVDGFCENNSISFIKQYPALWYIDEKGNVIIDESKKHPEIHYQGDIKDDEIFGTWSIYTKAQQYGYGYFEEVTQGTWTVKKEN